MNAQMRRIDLVCKLVGPLFIALLDGISTRTAIIVNFGMNVCSVVIEYYSIAKVRFSGSSSKTGNFGMLSLMHTSRCTMKWQNSKSQRRALHLFTGSLRG